MRVAVIIAARNVAGFVEDAIGSVLEQSHSDFSVIVVDDGSVDATAAIVSAFADLRLSLVQDSGRGVSAARNRGAAAAGKVDAFLFLDADDWLSPAALTTLTAALARHPDAVAAHTSFAFVAEASHPDAPGPQDRRRVPMAPDLLPRLLLGNLFANGGHVLIRAEAWKAAGPFREDLTFAEDWEFWTRLAVQGPFAAVAGGPMLFVRRRTGSLMHQAATRVEAYGPALKAIAANRRIADRLGRRRFARLLRRGERELSWTIGRERLRRGNAKDALPLLLRGFAGRFRPQRLAVLWKAWAQSRR